MNKKEMLKIIYADPDWFEINPAHCSKRIVYGDGLVSDFEFDHLLEKFDEILWSKEMRVIKAKLKDDERFFEFLLRKFSEKKVKEEFDRCLEVLSEESGMEESAFVIHWVRDQMVALTDVLKRRKQPKGAQADLENAIHNCALILGRLNQQINETEKKDILLKLAVEAGDYCALGVRRAASEIADGIKADLLVNQDPANVYEVRIRQSLENKRHRIIQRQYHIMAEQLGFSKRAAQDVHYYSRSQSILSLGFYPINDLDKFKMNVIDYLNWAIFLPRRRKWMMDEYLKEIEETVHEEGDQKFTEFMRQHIGTNENLFEEDRIELTELMASGEHHAGFQRLMLVMLGVLYLH